MHVNESFPTIFVAYIWNRYPGERGADAYNRATKKSQDIIGADTLGY